MFDVKRLLEKQAQWQRNRASLSWPEKIRMVEAIRESVQQLRASTNDEKRDGDQR